VEGGGRSTYAHVGGSEEIREMNRNKKEKKKEKDEKYPQECR
jgi:hypothetical protein